MKQLYFITITTTSLIFLGCTPLKTMPTPKKVSQSHSINTSKHPTPSLGTAIKRTKTPIESKKEPVELIEPPLTKEIIETTPLSIKEVSTKEETTVDAYGKPPKDYRTSIRKHLSENVSSHESIKYIFSRPYKSEKKDKSWRGWAVEVDMLKRNGKGEVLRNKPYTILFDGSSIVENLTDGEAKDIVKAVY